MSISATITASFIRLKHRADSLGIGLPLEFIESPPQQKLTDQWMIPISGSQPAGKRLIAENVLWFDSYLEGPAIRYVLRLIAEHKGLIQVDWHAIEYPTTTFLDPYDHVTCTRSSHRAMECVEEQCHSEGIDPNFVKLSDGSISVQDLGSEIARIRPMQFDAASNKGAVHRMVQLLKHACSDQSARELTQLLSVGYHQIAVQQSAITFIDDHRPSRTHSPIHVSLNAVARQFREALKYNSVYVSLGHAQELCAAYFGYQSWNSFKPIENLVGVSQSVNPAVIGLVYGEEIRYRYYQTLPEALADYAIFLDTGLPIEAQSAASLGEFELHQPPYPIYPEIPQVTDLKTFCKLLHQVDAYDIDQISEKLLASVNNH